MSEERKGYDDESLKLARKALEGQDAAALLRLLARGVREPKDDAVAPMQVVLPRMPKTLLENYPRNRDGEPLRPHEARTAQIHVPTWKRFRCSALSLVVTNAWKVSESDWERLVWQVVEVQSTTTGHGEELPGSGVFIAQRGRHEPFVPAWIFGTQESSALLFHAGTCVTVSYENPLSYDLLVSPMLHGWLEDARV